MPLTRQQADALVARPKRIGEVIQWRPYDDNKEMFRFQVLVACEDLDEPMYLKGVIGKTNWSFALLLQSTPLRILTVHAGGHVNPDGSDAGERHKHVWDEHHETRDTYYPEDIDFSDHNEALVGFLKECNIEIASAPEPLRLQRRLK